MKGGVKAYFKARQKKGRGFQLGFLRMPLNELRGKRGNQTELVNS